MTHLLLLIIILKTALKPVKKIIHFTRAYFVNINNCQHKSNSTDYCTNQYKPDEGGGALGVFHSGLGIFMKVRKLKNQKKKEKVF